jgi:hypothetical protein
MAFPFPQTSIRRRDTHAKAEKSSNHDSDFIEKSEFRWEAETAGNRSE